MLGVVWRAVVVLLLLCCSVGCVGCAVVAWWIVVKR